MSVVEALPYWEQVFLMIPIWIIFGSLLAIALMGIVSFLSEKLDAKLERYLFYPFIGLVGSGILWALLFLIFGGSQELGWLDLFITIPCFS